MLLEFGSIRQKCLSAITHSIAICESYSLLVAQYEDMET